MSFLFMLIRLALFIALALFITSFITSNADTVSIQLFPLPQTIDTPLYLVGLGMLGLGVFVGAFLTYATYVARTARMRLRVHQAEKKLKAAENEALGLRTEARMRQQEQKANTTASPLLVSGIQR